MGKILIVILSLSLNVKAEEPQSLQIAKAHFEYILDCVTQDMGRRNFDCFKSEFYNMKSFNNADRETLTHFKRACVAYQRYLSREDLAERCEVELILN